MSNKEYGSIPDEQKEYLGKAFDFESGILDENIAESESIEEKEKVRILIAGATGVGKSALINAVFGKPVVPSGDGQPVTQQLTRIDYPEKGIVLFDTKGIESKDYKKTIKQLKNDFKNNFDNYESFLSFGKKIKETLDLVWLCVDSNSSRFEGRDVELINLINKNNIPVVVVFTKYLPDDKDANRFINTFKSEVDKLKNNNKFSYTKVNSLPKNISGISIPQFGIDDLINKSESFLSEIKAEALIQAQESDPKKRLHQMNKSAQKKVKQASWVAGLTGFTPIPLADAPIIAGIQGKMIHNINAAFELSCLDSKAITVTTGILGTTAIAQLGKTIVRSGLKMIPVAGTVIGGAFAGTTAATITATIGNAYIQVLTRLYNDETMKVEFPESTAAILSLFQDYLQQKTTVSDNDKTESQTI